MNANDVQTLYADTAYWHGTGRYKYDENGTIVDVLRGMIAEGGLVPHDDDWDWKLGKIQSISFARSRMYGRLYAGMFVPHGKRIDGEYGSRWLWFQYFMDTARVVAFIEHRSFYGLLRDYPQKLALWTRKITRQKRETMRSVFLKGTDIDENYPILIGIKRNAIKPILGARVFSLHETKSETAITFDGMTHIEVPRDRMAETVVLLQDAGITTPVIPIEHGEEYCRQFSFCELVSGRPLAA
jgi:hypothetical protein